MSVAEVKSPKSAGSYAHLRLMMPYKIIDVDGQAIALNREYKPIGVAGKSWSPYIEYEPYVATHGLGSCLTEVQFFGDLNPPWDGILFRDEAIRRVLGWMVDSNLIKGLS